MTKALLSVDPTADSPRQKRLRAVWIYLVLLASFVVYAPSIGNDFTWDDRWAAMGDVDGVKHPLVAELRPLGEYFTTPWWPHKTEASRTYRPVTVLSFALRHAVCGDSARAAHAANVALHLLAVFLCWLLLLALRVPWSAAVAGTAAFALHAIHSEAVANVVGRAELLAFCFGAGATLLLGRGVTVARGCGVAALLFLCFASKESGLGWAAFAPLFLLVARRLHDQAPVTSRRDALGVVAIVVAPALLFLWFRHCTHAGLDGADPSIGYLENPLLFESATVRLYSGTLAWAWGLVLTLLPFDLAVDYGPAVLPVVASASDPWFPLVIAAGLALAAVCVAGLLCFRRHPLPFLAVAVFAGFSFALTNIPFPVFMPFAERVYFTPSLGLAFAVAWLARPALASRPRGIALGAAFAVWLLASSVVILQRNAVWADDHTLILSEVETNPRSVRMHLCAGDLWRGRGRLAEAERHFRTATALDPASPHAWFELARVLVDRGMHAEAASALQRAREARLRDRVDIEPELDALAQRLRAAAPR